jgi:hypothetical protein
MPDAAEREKKKVSWNELGQGVALRTGLYYLLQVPATPKPDLHVLAAQLHAIGDTQLAHEKVQIVDPDTGEPVGEPITADEEGRIRAQVPADKEYHLRLVGDPAQSAGEPEPASGSPDDGHSLPPDLALLARFTDRDGKPLAAEPVHLSSDEGEADLTTDAQGELHVPTTAGLYSFRVRGEEFRAHPVLLASDTADSHYQFVVLGGR